jgi:hypothetical protein
VSRGVDKIERDLEMYGVSYACDIDKFPYSGCVVDFYRNKGECSVT